MYSIKTLVEGLFFDRFADCQEVAGAYKQTTSQPFTSATFPAKIFSTPFPIYRDAVTLLI
jgi:hypothetical protein